MRRDVVDKAGALDADFVEKFEECSRIGAIALDIGVVLATVLDQRERGLVHHVVGHDVDVDVDDRLHRVAASGQFHLRAFQCFAPFCVRVFRSKLSSAA